MSQFFLIPNFHSQNTLFSSLKIINVKFKNILVFRGFFWFSFCGDNNVLKKRSCRSLLPQTGASHFNIAAPIFRRDVINDIFANVNANVNF